MTIFQVIAILLSCAALAAYLNHRFLRLPATVAHMAFALLFSLAVIVVGEIGWVDTSAVSDFVNKIDFSAVLLHGMLSVLLFAGALHINLSDLRGVKESVFVLATAGVMIATFITGSLTWFAAQFLGLKISYIYALLFGALISPTDPIAVLGMLKQAGASRKLHVKIGAESLFNDGVGVVVFLAILGAATNPDHFAWGHLAFIFLKEAVGGVILGIVLGWMAYNLMRAIDEHRVEVLITLALVTGGYSLAEYLTVSAPISMVVAGLIIGNHARALGMSEKSRIHLDIFWDILDEIFNAILFLLLGLELMIMPVSIKIIIVGLLAIGAVLAGRLISVGVPIALMRLRKPIDRGTIRLMTWGGLRGGLSIAMALSLPAGPEKSLILPFTYIVVLFSILVQGLTFKSAIRFILKK